MKLKSFLLAAVLVTGGGSAEAVVLSLWSFTGATGSQASTAVTTEHSLVSASTVTRGSGLTASLAGDSISSSGWTTTASADSNDYYQFGLTPDVGATITIQSISFAERRSATGIRSFEIRSSLDGYAAAITGTSTGVPDDTNTRNQSFTMPSGFANLSGTVTFRIYGYAAEASGGTWRLANHSTENGLVISGTAVPEPGAALLGGVGLLCLLRRRR